MKKINIRKPYFVIALILVITLAIIGGTYGYFIHKNADDGVVVSSNFFFESDYLSEEGKTYTLNTSTTKISFKLKNYADDLRWSENDIEYTITVNGGTLSQKEGKLPKDNKSYHIITLSGLEEGKTYNVSVIGEAGYTKTLKATFIVRNHEIEFYKNIDASNSNFVSLTVWSKNIEGIASVVFPDGVIPDNTCKDMENVLTINGKFEVNIEPYSSYVFRFFKGQGYDINSEFAVYINHNGVNIEAISQKI